MAFSVTFEMNGKQLIGAVLVMSYYGEEPLTQVKMARREIGPFDEMTDLVQELITNCALQHFEQLTLDYGRG